MNLPGVYDLVYLLVIPSLRAFAPFQVSSFRRSWCDHPAGLLSVKVSSFFRRFSSHFVTPCSLPDFKCSVLTDRYISKFNGVWPSSILIPSIPRRIYVAIRLPVAATNRLQCILQHFKLPFPAIYIVTVWFFPFIMIHRYYLRPRPVESLSKTSTKFAECAVVPAPSIPS